MGGGWSDCRTHGLSFISARRRLPSFIIAVAVTVVLRPHMHMQIDIFGPQDGSSIKFSSSGDSGLCRIVCYCRCCNAV